MREVVSSNSVRRRRSPIVNTPADRLIVALDFPALEPASRLVEDLDGIASFFKVGLELCLAAGLRTIRERLGAQTLFVDLKLPDDIPETIKRTVALATELDVKLMTLSAGADAPTMRAAVAGRGGAAQPKFLFVPIVSSMDRHDFAATTGRDASEFDSWLCQRAARAIDAGCDGVIASGDAIRLLRQALPEILIVSPGIRPSGAATHDHKRSSTPGEAIANGADLLVVGRPIRDAGDRAARRRVVTTIVEEIERATGR